VVGVDGVAVLLVSDFTTAAPPAGAGAVVEVTDWRTDSGAFEPPLPTEGTVVLGVGATVVLMAGAVVVGGVAGATVVTGALLAAVPWVWVPAGGEAGADSAEAGRAFSTRKSPARSAKEAAHLRGLTTSVLELLLIGLNRPPWLAAGAAAVGPPQGRGKLTMAPEGPTRSNWPLTCTFSRVGMCWTDQRFALDRALLPTVAEALPPDPVLHRVHGQRISAVTGATAPVPCS
jgi:hypothetical protein